MTQQERQPDAQAQATTQHRGLAGSTGSASVRGHALMDGEELSAVAQHCNERKQAAKNVQVGSPTCWVPVLFLNRCDYSPSTCSG